MRLRVNQALLAFFSKRRIYSAQAGKPGWREGDVVLCDDDAEIEPYAHFWAGGAIPRRFGAFSYALTPLDVQMSIGRYCSIGQGVSVMGLQHPTGWAMTSTLNYLDQLEGVSAYFADRGLERPPLLPFDPGQEGVSIGHDVWIGSTALIKRGVTIGHGAVVAARAVVTRDVPPYAVVAGMPARIVRYRFADAVIQGLLASQWWNYGPDVLAPLDVRAPEFLADRLADAIAAGAEPLALSPVTTREMIQAVEPEGAAWRP